jgi:glycosyltransferase involved in cell wall biosynthesis
MKVNFDLFIIGNERISYDNAFYSENIDFKTLAEGLKKNFKLKIFAKKSIEKKNFLINFSNIILSSNIITYLFKIFFSLKRKNSKYLIISITPYTFLSYLIIFLFSNKIFLYLRSDGFKEYESILGKRWVFLYRVMYFIMLKKSKIIACTNQLSGGQDFFLVQPSELDEKWFINRKVFIPIDKINILYVGRIRIEKGIFSMLELFSKLDDRFLLTIIGDKKIKQFEKKNINFINFLSSSDDLIKEYDKNHILFLPSYTEAHPKVVDEALSRLRPIIIFEDIKHIICNRSGIFITKRSYIDFLKVVNFIIINYRKITDNISKNNLPTKKKFIDDISRIINYK